MKIICPNPKCNSTKTELLYGEIYKCNECRRVFSIITGGGGGGILIRGLRVDIKEIPETPRPLKPESPEYPHVFIKIGGKGISEKLLAKKILSIEGLSEIKTNSLLKKLKINKIE